MKYAILCGAAALALFSAVTLEAAGPGQKLSGGYNGGYYGGGYYGHYNGGGNGIFGGGHHGGHGHGYGGTPGWDISPNANYLARWYGRGHHGAYGVPTLPAPAYEAGPPTPAVTYPYYTTRGPRDFLMDNPPSIGP